MIAVDLDGQMPYGQVLTAIEQRTDVVLDVGRQRVHELDLREPSGYGRTRWS